MPFHKSHDADYLHLTEKNVILGYYYVSININIIPPSCGKKCILGYLGVYVHKYDSNPLVQSAIFGEEFIWNLKGMLTLQKWNSTLVFYF
jgi:hypothetical protein